MGGRPAVGGEHSAAESEWEREDGVLPLDHLKRGAQVVQDGHGSILNQGRTKS